MIKQLHSNSSQSTLEDTLRAQQEALMMQGVSSRIQIKEELRETARQPIQEVKSNSKRLKQPVENPEFISTSVGIGRMSKNQVRDMKRENFGRKAESMFGDMNTATNQNMNFDF